MLPKVPAHPRARRSPPGRSPPGLEQPGAGPMLPGRARPAGLGRCLSRLRRSAPVTASGGEPGPAGPPPAPRRRRRREDPQRAPRSASPARGKRSNRSPVRSAGHRGPSASRSLPGILLSLFNFLSETRPKAGPRTSAGVPARTPAEPARRRAARPGLAPAAGSSAPRSLAQICLLAPLFFVVFNGDALGRAALRRERLSEQKGRQRTAGPRAATGQTPRVGAEISARLLLALPASCRERRNTPVRASPQRVKAMGNF